MTLSSNTIRSPHMNTPPLLDAISTELPALDPVIADAVRARWDSKTKPLGSLGDLEALAVHVAQIQGRATPAISEPHILVFAGDHGAAREGVSAYPQDVTWQMVMNFLAGGAAISVLARELGSGLTVVDAGVNHDFDSVPGLVSAKIDRGTASYLHEPAMSAEQCRKAIAAGQWLARDLPADCLLLGEMGIGNTASASLLMHHLSGVPLAECVGPGTGLDAAGVARKLALLQQATERHALAGSDATALTVLATFGGFEIAMLVGAVIGAVQARKVVLADGFIVGAAVLVAQRLVPGIERHLVFAHESAEPAHRRMLAGIGARPLLHLGMRLGEGSGAAVALPLLRLALSLLADMATFESASVSQAR
jgi:nicotinate-nucleotide--dimethylbenzimidazole phosphoribosyltransferase